MKMAAAEAVYRPQSGASFSLLTIGSYSLGTSPPPTTLPRTCRNWSR
jgi:hypothetical protein